MFNVKFHVRQIGSTPCIWAVIVSNDSSIYISKQKSVTKAAQGLTVRKKQRKDEELKHSLLPCPTKMDNSSISSRALHLTEDRAP